jgi:anion-transporting  ArsA/GET3 family ATPase
VLNDVVEFLRAFTGMETSFRQRAITVQKMWRSDSTAFVLVATPTTESLNEISRFNDELLSAGISSTALIANGATKEVSIDVETSEHLPAPAAEWLRRQSDLAESERTVLRARDTDLPEVAVVGRLHEDVHDVDGLLQLADELVSTSSRERLQ